MSKFLKIKIISGGQTGADMAGLDFAIANNGIFDFGGTVPKGWRQLDSNGNTVFNLEYLTRFPGKFIENSAYGYAQRTKKNIDDSDLTLVIAVNKESSGTKLTVDYALKKGKSCLVANPDSVNEVISLKNALKVWLSDFHSKNPNDTIVINVAGNGEKSSPGIYFKTLTALNVIFNEDT